MHAALHCALLSCAVLLFDLTVHGWTRTSWHDNKCCDAHDQDELLVAASMQVEDMICLSSQHRVRCEQ